MYCKSFHGMDISALGLGGLRFPLVDGSNTEIDKEKTRQIIDTAIQGGVNYFDTAYTYQNGNSERILGELLSAYPRESYYLATKFYPAAGITAEEMFEEQLSRCRTTYFDFYLIHSVNEKHLPAIMNPSLDSLGYLQRQKEQGRIRYLGFSSHATPDTLSRFLDWNSSFDMALIQLNYLDWTLLNAKKQYEILTDRGLPVWVMEPLKGGRMAQLNPAGEALLHNASPNRSTSSWGFRFLMGLPNVHTVLSGMSSLEQLQDNLNTFQQPDPLSADECNLLDRAANAFLAELGVPCSACRYCCPTCPAQLDIPTLIQGYNRPLAKKGKWDKIGV